MGSAVACSAEQSDAVATGITIASETKDEAELTAAERPDIEQFVTGYGVGEGVIAGDWTVVGHSVTNPYRAEDGRPAKGLQYLQVDVEVGYNGSDPVVLSTERCFELRDADKRALDGALVANPIGKLDGEITDRRTRRGGIVYEVPTENVWLHLHFGCDERSETAVIDL